MGNPDKPIGGFAIAPLDQQLLYIEGLEVENARLQAIADKLPKTADGVLVVPGMPVYHPEFGQAWLIRAEMGKVHFQHARWSCVDRCYSTLEAAKAAKAKEGE